MNVNITLIVNKREVNRVSCPESAHFYLVFDILLLVAPIFMVSETSFLKIKYI